MPEKSSPWCLIAGLQKKIRAFTDKGLQMRPSGQWESKAQSWELQLVAGPHQPHEKIRRESQQAFTPKPHQFSRWFSTISCT